LKEKIEENQLNNFIKQLNSIIKGINDTKLEYFILYAFYELVWIKNGLPISPADTRVPTHSVFDHNYAIAAAVNLFIQSNDKPNGLVVTIDIPGVQEYISASRKLRDLRISSYLVSLIAWKIVEEFVELYGPDILILPTTRFNPFFYTYLLGKLASRKYEIKELYEFLKLEYIDEEKKEIKILEENKFPKFGVIPPTITFILPPLDYLKKDEEFLSLLKRYGVNEINLEKDPSRTLKDIIYNIFNEQWQKIYNIIKNIKENSDIKIDEKIIKLIANIVIKLEDIKNNFNFEIPPFDLRIILIDVNEDILNKKRNEIFQMDNEINYNKIYGLIFDKINFKLSTFKHLKIDNFAKTKLTDYASQLYKLQSKSEIGEKQNKGRGYEYCTVCGKLPAILTVKEEGKFKFLDGNEYKHEEKFGAFANGEKFCPYCLIKRLLTIEDLFELLLRRSFNNVNCKVDIKVPSLADISTYELKVKLIKEISNNELFAIKFIEKAEEIAKTKKKQLKFAKSFAWRFYDKLSNEINQNKKFNERQKGDLEYLLVYEESEEIFLKDYRTKQNWVSFAKQYKVDGEPGIYYVLIKSDADNMGKIVTGDIFLPLHLETDEVLIEKCTNYYLKEYLKRTYNLEDILSKQELDNQVQNAINKSKITTIISLSYHSSVSKALMLNALLDNSIIEEFDGFTIYAGGDDLLALSPVSKGLEIINETSRNFIEGSSDGFYHLGNNYYIPTIKTGRSYVMYIAHYMYPMYSVIKSSNDYLEDHSKEGKWKIAEERYKDACLDVDKILKKNSLTIVYSPRGSETFSTLPLYNLTEIATSKTSSHLKYKNVLSILNEIIEDLQNDVYSIRLIYDLNEGDNIYRWKILNESKKFELLNNDIVNNVVNRHLKIQSEKKIKN